MDLIWIRLPPFACPTPYVAQSTCLTVGFMTDEWGQANGFDMDSSVPSRLSKTSVPSLRPLNEDLGRI
jgi:hypothetical protein